MSVTIKDVAKAAGVSVATVSRVLNGSANVSEAATKAVNDTIKALNYSPNFLGRNLRKCVTNSILVIQPSSEHSLYSKIIAGMQEAAAAEGYDIITSISNGTPEIENRQLNMLYNRTVDGAVLLGTVLGSGTINSLAQNYHIALCCEGCQGADVLTVVVDDELGGYDAAKALIDKGHTKIAIISTLSDTVSSANREKGFFRALEENGIDIPEGYVYRGDYGYEHGRAAIQQFMALEDRPTAVFAISDLLAAAAIKEATDMGVKIGEELAVIGFDDITWCERYIPTISSIAQPCDEMGRFVLKKLLENINGKADDTGYYTMKHTVMLRASTGD